VKTRVDTKPFYRLKSSGLALQTFFATTVSHSPHNASRRIMSTCASVSIRPALDARRATSKSTRFASRAHRYASSVVVKAIQDDYAESEALKQSSAPTRRALLASVALAVGASAIDTSANAGEGMLTYEDPKYKFKVTYPSDWVVLKGETPASEQPMGGGAREVWTVAPADANARDVNVTIVATPSGADFTRMGSLGDAYGFGMGLTTPLNKPKLRKGKEDRVQYCDLVDSVSVGEYYKVEYTLRKPSTDLDQVHFVLAGLGYDGRVPNFYTSTGVYPRPEDAKWRSAVEGIIDSISYPPTLY